MFFIVRVSPISEQRPIVSFLRKVWIDLEHLAAELINQIKDLLYASHISDLLHILLALFRELQWLQQ